MNKLTASRRRTPGLAPALALVAGLLLVLGSAAPADGEGDWQDAGQVGPGSPAEAAPTEEATPAEALPADGEAPTCVMTGLPWLESSTRVEAIFRVNGQRLRGKFLSLAYMLIQYKLLKEEGRDVQIETVSVLDFASFGTGSERMIPVNDEWSNIVFISTDTPLKGSKEPYYAAFSTIEDIEAAKENLSGKVMSYEAVMKRLLASLREDKEPEAVESEADSMRRHFKDFNPTSEE